MPRELVEQYFWVCLWQGFHKRLFESVDRVEKIHPLQLAKSLNGTKRQRKGKFLSAWSEASIFSCLWTSAGTPGSRSFRLGSGLTPSAPDSQAFRLRRNYTTSFLGSLACRWRIMGLLGLCNCVSQSHDQSPLLHIYVYILLVLFL